MAAVPLLAGLIVVTGWGVQPGAWWEVTPRTPPRPVFGSPVMPSVYRGPLVPPLPNRAFGAAGQPVVVPGRPYSAPYLPAVRGTAGFGAYHNPAALYSRTGRLAELRDDAEAPAAPETPGPVRQVVATGAAPIRDGDRQAARQMAIQQALRHALEQVAGAYVSGTTVTEKLVALQDRVYVHSEGFVVPDEVLEETSEQGVVTVRLRASVSLRPLVDRLRQLGLTRTWRVGVRIREAEGASLGGAAPLAHSAIVQRLLRAGFQVVDVAAGEEAEHPAAPSAEADILITGTAAVGLAARLPVTSGDRVLALIPLYQSRIEASAVRAETGEVIASHLEEDLVSDRVDALAAGTAVQLAARRIAGRFLGDLAALPASTARRVRLEVAGFADRSRAQALEEALRLLPGVRGTHAQEFTNGTLTLEVEMDAVAADRIGTDLERAAVLREFGLTVTAETKARIQARVKPH